MQASLNIDESIAARFTELRMKRAHRYLIVSINQDGTQATVETTGARDQSFDSFKASVPTDEPRYAIYDLEYNTKDGRKESKLVFVMYSPDTCKNSTLRFVYA